MTARETLGQECARLRAALRRIAQHGSTADRAIARGALYPPAPEPLPGQTVLTDLVPTP